MSHENDDNYYLWTLDVEQVERTKYYRGIAVIISPIIPSSFKLELKDDITILKKTFVFSKMNPYFQDSPTRLRKNDIVFKRDIQMPTLTIFSSTLNYLNIKLDGKDV
jgi:hypothetical protein